MGRGVQGWVEFWPMKIRSAGLSNPNSLIATFEEYVCLVINLFIFAKFLFINIDFAICLDVFGICVCWCQLA